MSSNSSFAKLAATLVASLALSSAGCASSPDETPLRTEPVDPAAFQLYVSPVFERRCGSLDCHGNLARGLRIYSSRGLRLPNTDGLTVGSGETSQAELRANYASVVGLEPEQMGKVRAAEADIYSLLVLKKPIADPESGGERHKGGPAIVKGDPAEQCIYWWLEGTPKPDLCARGAGTP